MKASLEQRIDYQAKCDRSVEFCATKREPEVKTTTTTKAAVVHLEKAQKDEAESKKPNLFLKAELTADRTPAKEPIL